MDGVIRNSVPTAGHADQCRSGCSRRCDDGMSALERNTRTFPQLEVHHNGTWVPVSKLAVNHAGCCHSSVVRHNGLNHMTLSSQSALKIQSALESDLLRDECRIAVSHYKRGLSRSPQSYGSDHSIDKLACSSLSRIIRESNMSVEDATKFLRCEVSTDSRPNTALDPERLRWVLDGYPYFDLIVQIAPTGSDVKWRDGPSVVGLLSSLL
ncbi:unnamed protein product [Phytophthora fragariaefolia]|uniref:Unnamed protein product n=1 Tax=Phytophthora fragariaefolia TaxID=1490495 RepID=A0A9W6YEZ8_9STRA|nr:unnamed protein product [Phytophthora fragariaefolia]